MIIIPLKMALIFLNKTTCALCAETIRDTDAHLGFTAFLPSSHPLWRYSDAAFHSACYDSWQYREKFQQLHDRFKEAFGKRPPIPEGMLFNEFEKTKAFIDFNKSLKNLFLEDEA